MRALPEYVSGIVLLSSLLACGGGEIEPQLQLSPRAMADGAEARARALLQTKSCSISNQCGFVMFQAPYNSCSQGEYAAYLPNSRSGTAAATAAQEQRYWALEARKLEPPPNFACAAFVEPPPIPVCLQSQCSLSWEYPATLAVTIEP